MLMIRKSVYYVHTKKNRTFDTMILTHSAIRFFNDSNRLSQIISHDS